MNLRYVHRLVGRDAPLLANPYRFSPFVVLHRCAGCSAMVSNLFCVKCQRSALARRAQERLDTTARFLDDVADLTVDLAADCAEEEQLFLYGKRLSDEVQP